MEGLVYPHNLTPPRAARARGTTYHADTAPRDTSRGRREWSRRVRRYGTRINTTASWSRRATRLRAGVHTLAASIAASTVVPPGDRPAAGLGGAGGGEGAGRASRSGLATNFTRASAEASGSGPAPAPARAAPLLPLLLLEGNRASCAVPAKALRYEEGTRPMALPRGLPDTASVSSTANTHAIGLLNVLYSTMRPR
jgi:hypothetical protein